MKTSSERHVDGDGETCERAVQEMTSVEKDSREQRSFVE